ncbi:RDD family protein [Pyxidicoccus parkwayensis]|uniref:RDD family protein n=2 Tax=Pyxidicoccus parkwayensis TaxID=2813578 RepID=A0ABX7PD60_9BACT|nr:RDD family protein [Pyxidicoccus parkwaysis]
MEAVPSAQPRMESATPAQAPGLPHMEPLEHAAPGLPRMESAAPAQAPGLPRMESLPPAPAAAPNVGIARSEAIRAPAAKGINASSTTEVHARPASLWRRLLSFTVDTAAIAGVAALYITLASSVTGTKAPAAGLVGLDAFVAWLRAFHTVLLPGFFLVLVLALVYCAVAAFLWNGRTLGRLLLGLRLVDTHGVAPAPGRAIVRAVLASLSFVLFLGGFWMALFDRRGQTLHDKLTSTFVVQPS